MTGDFGLILLKNGNVLVERDSLVTEIMLGTDGLVKIGSLLFTNEDVYDLSNYEGIFNINNVGNNDCLAIYFYDVFKKKYNDVHGWTLDNKGFTTKRMRTLKDDFYVTTLMNNSDIYVIIQGYDIRFPLDAAFYYEETKEVLTEVFLDHYMGEDL
jgi:hypothetical protein